MLKKNKTMIAVFLTPALICYMLFFLYPTIRTFVMSFFRIESISDSVSTWKFFGFGNYKKLFSTPIFLQSMYNIARIWCIGGLGTMFMSLLFAFILSSGIRAKSFFRSAIYLPNVVSAVAMGTMWINYIYNPDYGLLYTVLHKIGILEGAEKILWTGPGNLFWSMLVAYCFGMVGYHMLIFMSGIEQIPRDYYEAALLDGCNGWQRFIHITVPFLRGVARTNLVMWTVYTVGFFVWGQLFSPVNLSNDTVAPMNYMYELVFGSSSAANTARDTGAGAAIGIIMMLIVIVVFLLTSRIVKNDDTEV
ncbi:sugar ABC transporter permease [Treponema socranskii subsp. buccale]|uniref:carbohydrate ABC transporter permease n=1 Tax=Treponema socranskii TaxID=53419 RepID=UPI0020A4B1CA|nr:sugar ABC transporter permease [Treponema socranskii]UTD02378.1 sugar ABC transporter permease [Treponema socranskii subsp. buccale]